MLSFLLTIRQLVQSLAIAWRVKEFRHLLILLLILIASGMIFYSNVEGWSLLDSLYFSVITLATVGYGDFAPKTSAGKVFTIVYLFIGIGLFVAVVQGLAKAQMHRRHEKNKPD